MTLLTRPLRLRQKLFVLPMAGLLAGTILVGVFISLALERLAATHEREQLECLGLVFEEGLRARGGEAAVGVEMTLAQGELSQGYRSAQSGSAEPLRSFLRNAARRAGVDDAVAIEKDGRVLCGAQGGIAGTPFAPLDVVRPLLQHAPLVDVSAELPPLVRSHAVVGRTGAALITVGPLVDKQRGIVGAIAFIERIDREFLQRQKAHLPKGVDLSVADRTRVLASTLAGIQPPVPLTDSGSQFSGNLEGRVFRHHFVPVGSGGLFLGMSLDTAEAAKARRGIQWLMAAAFTLGLGIIGAFLFFTVTSLTAPLRTVVAKLAEFSSGEADLTRTLEVHARDEVGELAQSFNDFVARMGNTMRRFGSVATDLSHATEQVRSSSREVNEGATQQARLLGESVAALRGIDEAVAGIAESTTELLDSAAQSSATTQQLGATNETIASQVEHLFVTVDGVSSSIAQMSMVSQQISASMEHLAASAEETASAVIELDASVMGIQENAETTSRLSEGVAGDAEKGKEAVDASIQGVTALKELADRSNGVIEELGTRATAIGKILNVIDEVADQTGLLALNAAIIAAQAGEHGKGFAVVAAEIGELAERTAASTQEIATIIEHLQQGAREAVRTMSAGRERAELEVGRAREAGVALAKIRESAFTSLDQARNIARAAQEQTKGSRQITLAVDRIANMLGDVVGAASEHHGGAQKLAQAAQEMREIASLVNISVREQAQGSFQIGQNVEHIRAMTEQISEATREQTERSGQVLAAVTRIRTIAEGNVSRTAELDQVVEILSRQTSTLEEETGTFRV